MAEEVVESRVKKKVSKSEEIPKFIKVDNLYGNQCWLNLDSIVIISASFNGSYVLHCSDSNAYSVSDRSLIAHLID